MSKNTLIILPEPLKKRTEIHENVNSDTLSFVIKRVQDFYILPLLGSKLFNKLILDIDNASLAGDYKTLVDDYLIDVIANYVMADLPYTLQSQFYNVGVVANNAQNGQAVQIVNLKQTSEYYRQNAVAYAERARLYLVENAEGKYPEYAEGITKLDEVSPSGTGYNCPINLD